MKIVKLVLPVRARYLRFYPKNCLPVKCCLAVEVYGCEPGFNELFVFIANFVSKHSSSLVFFSEFDKKIVEPEGKSLY